MPDMDWIITMEKLIDGAKKCLFIGLVIVPIGIGVDKFVDYNRFNHHVYGDSTTPREKRIKEMNFYEKTGIIFENMSAFDRSAYGDAIQKGFIKNCD